MDPKGLGIAEGDSSVAELQSELKMLVETANNLGLEGDIVLAIVRLADRERHVRELVGLWVSAVLLLLFGVGAFFLGMTNHEWLAGIVFTTTVLGVGTIFVLRQQPSRLH